MYNYKKHIIPSKIGIKEALRKLNELAADAILFVVTSEGKLLGSLTDGDVRRGFLRNLTLESLVDEFLQPSPKFIRKGSYAMGQIIEYRETGFRIIPVLNENNEIINIINFRFLKSYLPLDAIIMAGGEGKRLRPLTEKLPKPLLEVGNKTIIEHNLTRLTDYGIDDFWISVHYLGALIENHLVKYQNKGIAMYFVYEKDPMGTIGAIKQIGNLKHDYVLITNSDILTNLDYEDFFIDFLQKEADISVLSVPYKVEVPYAVLETSDGLIHSFKEKPSYTYFSNGGIYIMKKEIIEHIPDNNYYNATDLIQFLIKNGNKVITYPMRGYWLDIGNPDDYKKAIQDFDHINFR